MIHDAHDLSIALAGTTLEGREVRHVVLPAGAGTALVVACASHEVRESWAAARSVLSASGRWPVVAASWASDAIDEEHFVRYGSDANASAAAILAAIPEVSAPESIDYFTNRATRPDVFSSDHGPESETDLRLALDAMQRTIGRSPSEAEVRTALQAPATDIELQRFLLHWELDNDVTPPTRRWHMNWYESDSEPYGVAFLPSPRQEDAVAHFWFSGADRSGEPAALAGVLRSWSERFGAELVAHYGTMLGFLVERPPTDIDDAFQLACEHQAVAPSTMSDVALRDHARWLVDRNDWFLHEDP